MAVKVKAILEEGQNFTIPDYDPTPSLTPIFKCVFEDISNGTYAYDVYWYICGTIIKNSTNILFDDIYDAIVLKESEWSDRYRMNMEVSF